MIQPLTPDQLDQLAPLWTEFNALHRDLDEVCGWSRKSTTWQDRLAELRDKAKGKSLIQAVDMEGQIVGYCFSSIDDSNQGEVDSLFVQPDWRGRGFGKDLIQNALQWFEDSGCTEIEMSVHPGNTQAVFFYWHFGFITEPRMKKVTDHPMYQS